MKWSQNHGHIFLLITWALGAAYAYIPYQYTSIVEFSRGNETYYRCAYLEVGVTSEERRLVILSNFVLTFAIPLCTLLFSYISIIRRLLWDQKQILTTIDASNSIVYEKGCRKAATVGQSGVHVHSVPFHVSRQNKRKLAYIRNRLKTIKIMFTVIILFCTSWAPIKVYQLLMEYDFIRFCSKVEYFALVYTYLACHLLAMTNSAANPFVYSFMSKSFRVRKSWSKP